METGKMKKGIDKKISIVNVVRIVLWAIIGCLFLATLIWGSRVNFTGQVVNCPNKGPIVFFSQSGKNITHAEWKVITGQEDRCTFTGTYRSGFVTKQVSGYVSFGDDNSFFLISTYTNFNVWCPQGKKCQIFSLDD
jgi:hypothetical protein